jgi:hypothetical protein
MWGERHLLVNEHILVQVGDVHVRFPDEFELVVAELDETAGRDRHGGQCVEACGTGDRVLGLILVLDAVDDLAVDTRGYGLDRRGVPDRARGARDQPPISSGSQVRMAATHSVPWGLVRVFMNSLKYLTTSPTAGSKFSSTKEEELSLSCRGAGQSPASRRSRRSRPLPWTASMFRALAGEGGGGGDSGGGVVVVWWW